MGINDKPLLSICISSYNRGEKCLGLVNKILALDDDRLNVVICDDCSNEKTQRLLNSIDDNRVILRINSTNLGACPNWYETIDHGTGRYILHVLDRDYIDTDMILSLLGFLENNDVGAGYLGMFFYSMPESIANGEIAVHKRGEDTAAKYGGLPFHPTGFFVAKDEWKKGDYKLFFYDESKFGIYPHSYVMCIVAMSADIVTVPGVFCKCVYSNRELSGFYNKKNNDFWWKPSVTFVTNVKMVTRLYRNFKDIEAKKRFIINSFSNNLLRATIRSRLEMLDAGQMRRYGQSVKNISLVEMLLINYLYTIKYYVFQKRLGIERSISFKELMGVANNNKRNIINNCAGSRASRRKLEDENKKHKEFYVVMYKWLKLRNSGSGIASYFEKKGYRNIAVYGMKELGELLCDELRGKEEINVKYCIDRNITGSYNGVPIRRPDEDLESVDVIVITAIHYFNEIESDLMDNVDCPVISIEDVIWG